MVAETITPRSAEAVIKTSNATVSTARLRVGFVMHVMQVAGAEVLVSEIIERLGSAIEPTILCLDEIGELGRKLQRQGVEVIALDRRPGLDWRIARRLAAIVRERRIEILHAHQYTPFFYSALARMTGMGGPKIIFTEHGRHFPDVVSSKRRLANRWLLQRYAEVATACCHFSADAVEKNDGFAAGSVRVLSNGVDLTRFQTDSETRTALRKRLGLQPDLSYVAMVARFHPIKDHATLLEAFAQVARLRDKVRLILVGDGPERANLEAQVARLNLTDRVEFWGIRHDVADILAAIDIFTLSSISEAASLTLLEAMACGRPVVVTRVGGNPEIVREGCEGLLTPRGDATAMAAALGKLLDDPALATKMGISGRQRVENCYRLDQTIESYHQLYRELVPAKLR